MIAEGTDDLTTVEVKKGFAKRSIEQLGFIKDVNSLVVLSGEYLSSITYETMPYVSSPKK